MSKKKAAAIILSIVLLAGLGTAGYFEYNHIKQVKAQKLAAKQQQPASAGKKPSEYEVGQDYNSVIKKNKPVLVLFYADWCRYCVRFMPIYEKAAEKYSKDIEFAKVNVEDKQYEKLVQQSRISGFPTVMIIDKKYDNKVIIPNSSLISVEDLSTELDRFTRIRKLLDSK